MSSLGAYVSAGNPSGVEELGRTIGHRPAWALDFLAGTTWTTLEHPTWFLHQWACAAGSAQCDGFQMVWSVPMLPDSGGSLAAGAAGAYDRYFRELAQRFVAAGQGAAVLRLGWEFNGTWYKWSAVGKSADFVAYWRRIVDAMNAVPGAAFRFEWCPSVGTLYGAGPLEADYPGNGYVSVIGMDVYDEAWGTYAGAASQFTRMEHGPYGLDWLGSFAAQNGKPIAFGEWGLGWGSSAPTSGPISARTTLCGGDNPAFIALTAQWLAGHDVLMVDFWDSGSSRVTGGMNPKTAAALGAVFSGSGPAAVPPAPAPVALVAAMAATPAGAGYWTAATDGKVAAHGDADGFGSMEGTPLHAAVGGMAAGPAGGGYWLVARDGGIFAFGDAGFYGSMGGKPLNQAMVGMAATPDGHGYWQVAADGGIFAFGDAGFDGSTAGSSPVASSVLRAAEVSAAGSARLLVPPG